MYSALQRAAKSFPVLTVTGPRQSGKTTLVRMSFPRYEYLNLENPETLRLARDDPRSVFRNLRSGLIIDEVQRFPELLSWAQVFTDELARPGRLILTGSNQFEYISGIGQSLAGRTAIFKLLPLSCEEIKPKIRDRWEDYAVKGFYPRIYDTAPEPQLFYSSFVMTYLERDIRALIQLKNLASYERFVTLCAGRTASILNLSSLATDCGVDQKTAAAWIDLLEASYVVYLLKPHYENLNKRIIKSPKLYFFDVGLVAYLLGIRNKSDLNSHPLRGQLFETLVVAEFLKYYHNRGIVPPLTYYRDSRGHEIDLMVNLGNRSFPVEIKSGSTLNTDFLRNIHYLRKLTAETQAAGLIFGDRRRSETQGVKVAGWDKVAQLLTEQNEMA